MTRKLSNRLFELTLHRPPTPEPWGLTVESPLSLNRKELARKASQVTTDLIGSQGYISYVDLFIGLGYLDKKDYEDWRMKRIHYLERVIKINLRKINFIMKTVRRNSLNGGLKPSWTGYKSWGKGRKTSLRFSKTGRPAIEKEYATHYVRLDRRKKKERRRQTVSKNGAEAPANMGQLGSS